MLNKYGFDAFNQWLFVDKVLILSDKLFESIDRKIIDSGMVHGIANMVQLISLKIRRTQTGYLYDYTTAMAVGIFVLIIISVVI